MSRLNDHNQEIKAHWKQLSSVWEDVQSKWRDQASSDFERHHWRPLEEHVRTYIKALESLCEGSSHREE